MPGLEPLLAGVRVGEEHPVAVGVEQRANLVPELGIGLLDPDVDLAAAGEPDLPGLAVGDAVMDAAGDLAGEEVLRALDDVGLDAAARDRADECAVLAHDHLRARLSWRRPDRVDHGRDDDALPGGARLVDHIEDVVHGSTIAPRPATAGRFSRRAAPVLRPGQRVRMPRKPSPRRP